MKKKKNHFRRHKMKIWPERSIFPMQLQMLSVTSNLAWMKTPSRHCYSWRILWLFLLFFGGWLSDSPQGLPVKQDPREMEVFLIRIATEGLKCRSPPSPPPKARSDCYKLLGQSKEATEAGLAVGCQWGIAPLVPCSLVFCWSSTNV